MYSKSPVLLIAFNRPGFFRKVLESIKKWQPNSLWFVVDAPRNQNEYSKVNEVKKIIDRIDWCSNIERNYANSNMGCRKRVHSGIDWFFDSNDQGIILEDDCVPQNTFFPFCEELLDKFSDNPMISTIQGMHRLPINPTLPASYYFSSYVEPHGWATWKRAWSKYSNDITDSKIIIQERFSNIRCILYWNRIFRLLYKNKIDSWGYRWLLSNWRNKTISVYPRVSLINNIGYGADATHTFRSSYKLMPSQNLDFPLKHPLLITINKYLDNILEDSCYSRSPSQRIRWFGRKLLGLNI